MATVNRFADLHDEITAWRRDLHENPETLYDVHRTAGIVAEKLRAFGCDEVVTGIGRTGVVGVIRGRETGSGRVVGMRADMDALPMTEITGLPWASRVPGKMHACGHDGHTAMLLGAARYLAETRNFDGTAVVIFQPAEEGGAGGRAMVEDGMMERFGIQQVYGMHNMPGIPAGNFAIRPGPLMAAADFFEMEIEGVGGHAAKPHQTVDTTLVACQLVTALQSIVARNVDPVESAVVSVTSFRTDSEAHNVIPQKVRLRGTVRTLKAEVRDVVEARFRAIVAALPAVYGARADLNYVRNYPVTVNEPAATAFASDVAAGIVGESNVERNTPPLLGGEDFSFMLNARPGAMIFVGNGDTRGVHHPGYDFNDGIIPVGCSFWARLAETAMPV